MMQLRKESTRVALAVTNAVQPVLSITQSRGNLLTSHLRDVEKGTLSVDNT